MLIELPSTRNILNDFGTGFFFTQIRFLQNLIDRIEQF